MHTTRGRTHHGRTSITQVPKIHCKVQLTLRDQERDQPDQTHKVSVKATTKATVRSSSPDKTRQVSVKTQGVGPLVSSLTSCSGRCRSHMTRAMCSSTCLPAVALSHRLNRRLQGAGEGGRGGGRGGAHLIYVFEWKWLEPKWQGQGQEAAPKVTGYRLTTACEDTQLSSGRWHVGNELKQTK